MSRTFRAIVFSLVFVEIAIGVCLTVHLPQPPLPIFKVHQMILLDESPGPYDHDSDGCDLDSGICDQLII